MDEVPETEFVRQECTTEFLGLAALPLDVPFRYACIATSARLTAPGCTLAGRTAKCEAHFLHLLLLTTLQERKEHVSELPLERIFILPLIPHDSGQESIPYSNFYIFLIKEYGTYDYVLLALCNLVVAY